MPRRRSKRRRCTLVSAHNDVSGVVYFTDDIRRTFPIETPQLAPVRYVEVRSGGDTQTTHTVRSGSMRLRPSGTSSGELSYRYLSTQDRAALQRLARTLAHQSVGVALGGGGALGYAHMPLLRALHDAGIPIDLIAGTSMGSMVACSDSSGGFESLDALIKAGPYFSNLMLVTPFTRRPLERMFKTRLLQHDLLQDLPLPTFSVAVDIQTGRARVFRSGPVSTAMFASTSTSFPKFVPGSGRPYLHGTTEFSDRTTPGGSWGTLY